MYIRYRTSNAKNCWGHNKQITKRFIHKVFPHNKLNKYILKSLIKVFFFRHDITFSSQLTPPPSNPPSNAPWFFNRLRRYTSFVLTCLLTYLLTEEDYYRSWNRRSRSTVRPRALTSSRSFIYTVAQKNHRDSMLLYSVNIFVLSGALYSDIRTCNFHPNLISLPTFLCSFSAAVISQNRNNRKLRTPPWRQRLNWGGQGAQRPCFDLSPLQ